MLSVHTVARYAEQDAAGAEHAEVGAEPEREVEDHGAEAPISMARRPPKRSASGPLKSAEKP
jgi:hypothetical protein